MYTEKRTGARDKKFMAARFLGQNTYVRDHVMSCTILRHVMLLLEHGCYFFIPRIAHSNQSDWRYVCAVCVANFDVAPLIWWV